MTRFASTKFGGAADQRSGFTTLIDGGDVDDAQWGSPTINLTQESVQEFRVFRYQFDAQYGNALNAVVSVVTKSGANRPEGSLFYFGRDDALNARNAFAKSKPPFDEHRLGGSLGGPLARNRTHGFAVYESDAVDTVRIVAVPAGSRFAARENGNFPATSDERMAVFKVDHRSLPGAQRTRALCVCQPGDQPAQSRAVVGYHANRYVQPGPQHRGRGRLDSLVADGQHVAPPLVFTHQRRYRHVPTVASPKVAPRSTSVW